MGAEFQGLLEEHSGSGARPDGGETRETCNLTLVHRKGRTRLNLNDVRIVKRLELFGKSNTKEEVTTHFHAFTLEQRRKKWALGCMNPRSDRGSEQKMNWISSGSYDGCRHQNNKTKGNEN